MSYYDSLWGSNVKFIVEGVRNQPQTALYGKQKGSEPLQLKYPPQGFPPGYPSYAIITVNGITEIIEHRKMEPIFYITDDPAVWSELMGRR